MMQSTIPASFWKLCMWLLTVLIMVSCEPLTGVNAEVFATDSFELLPVDSISIRVSTVRIDSIETGNEQRLLVGYQQDDLFGEIEASSFFQVGLDTILAIDASTSFFDSLTLSVTFDGYYNFDTSRMMELSVHQLTEAIDVDDGYFNTTSIELEPISLGTSQFLPKPQKRSTIEIRLSDQLGVQLFEMLQEETEIVTEESQFLDFLKGFCLLPATTTNSCVVGLVPAKTQLKLYYTDFAELPKRTLTRTFSAGGPLLYFNRIQTDYSNSPLEVLEESDQNQLDAGRTVDQSFIQGGGGLAVRMEFPYVRNLLESYQEFILSSAVLRMDPLPDPVTTKPSPPEALDITIVDADNDLLTGTLTTTVLSIDEEFNRDTYYEIDVTDFLKVQLALEENNQNALLFNVESQANSVERLILPDQNNAADLFLTIYLLKIK